MKILYWILMVLLGSTLLGLLFPPPTSWIASFFYGFLVGHYAGKDLLE